MSAAADTLKKVPLFAGLGDKEIKHIAGAMVERLTASIDYVLERI